MSDTHWGFKEIVSDAKSRIKRLTVEEVKAKQDAAEPLHIIDIREESEYANARIQGATHIGKGILERDIAKEFPDRSTTIVCYCGGGSRSALAVDNLRKMGYENAISMDGGFRGWKDAGHPIEE